MSRFLGRQWLILQYNIVRLLDICFVFVREPAHVVVDGNAGTLRQQRQDPSLECDNMDDNFDDGDDISDRVWGVIEDGEKGEVRRPEELAQPADCAQGWEETWGRKF